MFVDDFDKDDIFLLKFPATTKIAEKTSNIYSDFLRQWTSDFVTE